MSRLHSYQYFHQYPIEACAESTVFYQRIGNSFTRCCKNTTQVMALMGPKFLSVTNAVFLAYIYNVGILFELLLDPELVLTRPAV